MDATAAAASLAGAGTGLRHPLLGRAGDLDAALRRIADRYDRCQSTRASEPLDQDLGWSRTYEEELTADLFGTGEGLWDEDSARLQAFVESAGIHPNFRPLLKACLEMERSYKSDLDTTLDTLIAFMFAHTSPHTSTCFDPREPYIHARLERRARHRFERMRETTGDRSDLSPLLHAILIPVLRSHLGLYTAGLSCMVVRMVTDGGWPWCALLLRHRASLEKFITPPGLLILRRLGIDIDNKGDDRRTSAPSRHITFSFTGIDEAVALLNDDGTSVSLGDSSSMTPAVLAEEFGTIGRLCRDNVLVMESPFRFRLRTAADDARSPGDIYLARVRTHEMTGAVWENQVVTWWLRAQDHSSEARLSMEYVPLTTTRWADVAEDLAREGRLLRRAGDAKTSPAYSLPVVYDELQPLQLPDSEMAEYVTQLQRPCVSMWLLSFAFSKTEHAIIAMATDCGVLVDGDIAYRLLDGALRDSRLPSEVLGPNSQFHRLLALADEYVLSCVPSSREHTAPGPTYAAFVSFAASRYRLWKTAPPLTGTDAVLPTLHDWAAFASAKGCIVRPTPNPLHPAVAGAFTTDPSKYPPQPLGPEDDATAQERWQRAEAFLEQLRAVPHIAEVLERRDLGARTQGDPSSRSGPPLPLDSHPIFESAAWLSPLAQRVIQCVMLELQLCIATSQGGVLTLYGARLGTPVLHVASAIDAGLGELCRCGFVVLRQSVERECFEVAIPPKVGMPDEASPALKHADFVFSTHLTPTSCSAMFGTQSNDAMSSRGALEALTEELNLPAKVVATLGDRQLCKALETYADRLCEGHDPALLEDTAMLAEAVACRMVSLATPAEGAAADAPPLPHPGPTSVANRAALFVHSMYFSSGASSSPVSAVMFDLVRRPHQWCFDFDGGVSEAAGAVARARQCGMLTLSTADASTVDHPADTNGDAHPSFFVTGVSPVRKVAPGTAQELARWTRVVARRRFATLWPAVEQRLKGELAAHHRRPGAGAWPGVRKAKMGALLTQAGFEAKADRALALELAVEAGALVPSGECLLPPATLIDAWLPSQQAAVPSTEPSRATSAAEREPSDKPAAVTIGAEPSAAKRPKKNTARPQGVDALCAAVRRERAAAEKRAAAGGAPWAGLNRAQAGAALSAAGLSTKKQRTEALRRATARAEDAGGAGPLVEGAEGQLLERGDPAAIIPPAPCPPAVAPSPSTAAIPGDDTSHGGWDGRAKHADNNDGEKEGAPQDEADPQEQQPRDDAGDDVRDDDDDDEELSGDGGHEVNRDDPATSRGGHVATEDQHQQLPASVLSTLARFTNELAAQTPSWELREAAVAEMHRRLGITISGRMAPAAAGSVPESLDITSTATPAASDGEGHAPPRTLREIRERHGLVHDDGMANEVTGLAEPVNPWGAE